MKKIILSVIIAGFFTVFNSTTINAQAFEKGNINVGGSIGVGSTLGGGLPIGAHADYAITDAISAGIYAGFASYTSGYLDYNWKYNYTIIGVRGDYHFGELIGSLPEELDVYGGLGLYNYSVSVTTSSGYKYTGRDNSGLNASAHAGARYYFTDNIAAFVEASHEISYLQLGVTFKF